MRLSEIATHDVTTIAPDDTLRDAARAMRDRDIGSLPVCDGTHLLGMITDRDIACRAVAEGMDPERTCVRDAMTSEMVFCYNDADVEEAVRVMEDKQIRRLPVLNHDKRLVGIVSLGDIALRDKDDRLSGEALEQISRPSDPPHDIH